MNWAENKLSPEDKERINELNPENQLTQQDYLPVPLLVTRVIHQHSCGTLGM